MFPLSLMFPTGQAGAWIAWLGGWRADDVLRVLQPDLPCKCIFQVDVVPFRILNMRKALNDCRRFKRILSSSWTSDHLPQTTCLLKTNVMRLNLHDIERLLLHGIQHVLALMLEL